MLTLNPWQPTHASTYDLKHYNRTHSNT